MEEFIREVRALRRELETLRAQGAVVGERTAWTPTVTQTAGITLTSYSSIYVPIGPLVYLNAHITLGSAGTAGSHIIVSGLPVTIRPIETGGYFTIGNFSFGDAGTNSYAGSAVYTATDTIKLLAHATGDYLGSGPSFAVASGDILSINCLYRWL